MKKCQYTECPLYKNQEVPFSGRSDSKILFIGQAPRDIEVKKDKPFAGNVEELLDKMLNLTGINKNDIFMANSLRCYEGFPTLKNKDLQVALDCCIGNIKKIIEIIKPKLIVCLGTYAVKQMIGRGKVMELRGKLKDGIFVTLHPSAVLKECSKDYPYKDINMMNIREKVFYEDFKFISDFVKNNYNPPSLNLKGYVHGNLKDLQMLKNEDLISVDFETTSLDFTDNKLLSVSLSKEAGKSFVFYLGDKEAMLLIKDILKSDIGKIVASHPFDYKVAQKFFNINLGGKIHDVLVLAHLIDENNYKYNLENVASDYAGMRNIKDLAKDKRDNLSELDKEDLKNYNGCDSDATLQSFYNMIAILCKDNRLFNYYRHFMLPVMDMSSIICNFGVSINKRKLTKNSKEIENILKDKSDKLIDMIPDKIKKKHKDKLFLSRAELIKDVVFKGFKCKPNKEYLTRVTKQPQITEEHLSRFDIPFVKEYIDWKKLHKIQTSYIKTLPEFIKSDGKIYPSLVMNRTATGRSVILNPPIQTYPQRGKYADKIKECIVSDKGWLLGARDLSQSELRIMGWLAGDVNILLSLRNNIDLHTKTASIINNIPVDKVDKLMRFKAKGVNFGLIYGMSAGGLQKYLRDEYDIKYSLNECALIRHRFFSKPLGYYKLPFLYASIKQKIKKDGYITSVLGRKRRFPMIVSTDIQEGGLIDKMERQAINFVGQSFSSDLAMIAMFLFTQELKERSLLNSIRPLWFIHDSIIFTAEEKMMDKGMALLKECMEKRNVEYIKEKFNVTVGYPVQSDGKVGKNWASLESI